MINQKTEIRSYHFHNQGPRDYQEDFFYVDKENKLFIVCDGVGGSKHGDVASKVVVKSIVEQYQRFKGTVTKEVILQFIKNAALSLDQMAFADKDFEGMATTLAMLYIKKNKAILAHVGDSRVFYIRNNKDWFATKDHSVVRELYDAGVLKTEKEMHQHPFKNRITRALRASLESSEVIPDIHEVKTVFENQLFILCSDGALEHYLSQELVDHFSNKLIPFESLWNSFKLVCIENSTDNSTCIIIRT